MKIALITGITGQDGSYLSEFLLSKGYSVHGIIRRSSTFNTGRIDHVYVDPHVKGAKLFLHYGDLSDSEQINHIIYNIRPDEIYHLGAQSHVRVSFDIPEYTGNITGLSTIRLLEAIRRSKQNIKFYQASSSEMFGAENSPQSEETSFSPQSPYACAKVYSYWITRNYREGYNLFACNGILFNHESPRRGETFVTRKITRGLAKILAGQGEKIFLGNLNAKRDWGFAPEYVEMMWAVLQQPNADDYVIGTGESHSVKEFVEKSFLYVGISLDWKGKGLKTKGVVGKIRRGLKYGTLKAGDVVIEIDPRYYRPLEVDDLRANISKAKKHLKWSPRVTFSDLIKIMVDYDLKKSGLAAVGDGINVYRLKKFNYIMHEMTCPKTGN